MKLEKGSRSGWGQRTGSEKASQRRWCYGRKLDGEAQPCEDLGTMSPRQREQPARGTTAGIFEG